MDPRVPGSVCYSARHGRAYCVLYRVDASDLRIEWEDLRQATIDGSWDPARGDRLIRPAGGWNDPVGPVQLLLFR